MIRRGISALSVVPLVLILLWTPLSAQEPTESPTPPPFATVNGQAVSRDDWVSYLKAFHGTEALRGLIEERAVIQKAHSLGIPFRDSDVDQRILRMKTEYPTEAAFTDMLHERGISLNALKRQLKVEILLDRIVDAQAQISDEDVAAYYEAHLSEFSNPTRVRLHVITTDAIEKAYLAAERLNGGEEFATVAADLSIDEYAANGGFWGELTADEVEPEAVQVAAFNLEPGTRSEPIEVGGRLYVIWVESREPGAVVSETEAAPKIRDRMRKEKGLTREAVRRGILREAKVRVYADGFAHLLDELKEMGERQVVVDGVLLDLDSPPILVGGTMMVPAKAYVEALDASFEWFPSTSTMRLIKGDTTVLVALDSTLAIVNEDKVAVGQSPVRQEGVLYVPARWLAEALGGSVYWSQAEYTLKVKSVREETPEDELGETP